VTRRAQPAHGTTIAVMCQFSDLLLTPGDTMRDYYRRSYARMRGYELPTHFMEIPYWIPIVTSMLPERRYRHELLVVDDMEVALRRAAVPDDPVVFLSVMDASLPYALELAKPGARIVAGGYVEPCEFAPYPNVTYVDGIHRLREVVPGTSPASALDYRLFTGMRCIPRFSLSTGCSLRCTFCTVPTKLVLTPRERIAAEVDAIAELDFRLVSWTTSRSVRRRTGSTRPRSRSESAVSTPASSGSSSRHRHRSRDGEASSSAAATWACGTLSLASSRPTTPS